LRCSIVIINSDIHGQVINVNPNVQAGISNSFIDSGAVIEGASSINSQSTITGGNVINSTIFGSQVTGGEILGNSLVMQNSIISGGTIGTSFVFNSEILGGVITDS
jgi:hypothetical protein